MTDRKTAFCSCGAPVDARGFCETEGCSNKRPADEQPPSSKLPPSPLHTDPPKGIPDATFINRKPFRPSGEKVAQKSRDDAVQRRFPPPAGLPDLGKKSPRPDGSYGVTPPEGMDAVREDEIPSSKKLRLAPSRPNQPGSTVPTPPPTEPRPPGFVPIDKEGENGPPTQPQSPDAKAESIRPGAAEERRSTRKAGESGIRLKEGAEVDGENGSSGKNGS